MSKSETEFCVSRTNKKGSFSLPILFSISLHLLLVGGLVYASTQHNLPVRLDDADDGMSVMMLDFSGSPEPLGKQTVEPNEHTAEEESASESEPTSLVEPEVPSEPEVMPEPIQEPKIALTEKKEQPKPRPKPVPKPKPKMNAKPIGKVSAKPAAAIANNPNGDSSASKQSSGTGSTSGGKPLKRTKPAYPDRARSMGVEGEVKVRFDVDVAGDVKNIQILSETPKNLFSREVRRAMSRWRYEANKPAKSLQTTFVFRLSGKVDMR